MKEYKLFERSVKQIEALERGYQRDSIENIGLIIAHTKDVIQLLIANQEMEIAEKYQNKLEKLEKKLGRKLGGVDIVDFENIGTQFLFKN